MIDRFTLEHGGVRYGVFPRRDIVVIGNERAAERIATELLRTPRDRANIRDLLEGQLGVGRVDRPKDLFFALVRALVSGRLQLIRAADAARLLDEPQYEPLIDPLRPDPSEPLRPERPVTPVVDPPRPAPPEPPPPPVLPPPLPTWLAFEIVDQDGAPLLAEYSCTVAGQSHAGKMQPNVVRLDDLPPSEEARLRLDAFRYATPRRPGPPRDTATGADVTIEHLGDPHILSIPLGRQTRIVVELAKATVFTLGSYDLDHELFVPGMLSYDEAAAEGISGLGCLAQMLDYARAHPERSVLVVGHTDTAGSKSHNEELSKRRAERVRALLAADMDAWIDGCLADGERSDLAAYLRWAAQRFGWDCDPGRGDSLPPAALARYRQQAEPTLGITVRPDAKIGADDWRIGYGLLDLALSEELDLTLPELAELRSGLRWAEPATIGVGEHWPIVDVGRNDLRSPTNRRTEVCFLVPNRIPGGAEATPGANLYGPDSLVWLDYIDPEPRTVLPVSLVSTDDHPVPCTPLKLVSEAGRVRYGHLDEDGYTLLIDVQVGAFNIYYLDHDDIQAKVWAARFDVAQRNADVDAVRHVLELPPPVLQAVAREYGERFAGGDPEALPRQARALADNPGREIELDWLLWRAGWPDEVEYDQPGIRRDA